MWLMILIFLGGVAVAYWMYRSKFKIQKINAEKKKKEYIKLSRGTPKTLEVASSWGELLRLLEYPLLINGDIGVIRGNKENLEYLQNKESIVVFSPDGWLLGYLSPIRDGIGFKKVKRNEAILTQVSAIKEVN
ncbi:hypothetical protein QX249_24625 [Vibrio parahaemolyticus]|uniref:Uncharacterized protein n=1 Tax=Vibrio parahaemolyticus TaxID=670 RepID=A0AAW8Q975_VIBPH|nr:hypothetical protein [Vibrio parahaemolyticus]EGR2227735.1 hypothetical protein [Vibrio parahaemolyticus]MDS1823830.1 hypothetical protein [Vibrio parahaemolyticus]